MNKNKLMKQAVATSLVLSLALGGSATVSLAKGKDNNNGRGHGHGKGQEKQNGKFKLDLDDLKLEFKDVDMDWARQHIASLVAQGVFEGYADGTFQPNKKVTRLEALVTAVRLMDLRDEAESDAKMSVDLHLKDEHAIADWARGYVAVALEQDLFMETDDKLQPEKPADRLWVTTLLVKALGLEEEARAKMNTSLDFKDAHEIPAGSVGYVAIAVERGIVKGYDNNTFRPNVPVSRAEIAAFLDRSGDQLPDYQWKGTLKTAISGDTLTLQSGAQYKIDDDAYVFHEDDRIELDDLQAGDEISFITYNDVIIFIKLIDKAEDDDADDIDVTYNGVLSAAVLNNNLSVYVDGKLKLLPLDSDVDLYRAGSKVAASALKAGDVVQVEVEDGEVTKLIVVQRVEERAHFTGTIIEIDEDDEELVIRQGSSNATYEVEDDAVIYRNDRSADIDDLRAGDEVFVKLDDEEIVYIQVIDEEDGDGVTGVFAGTLSGEVSQDVLSVYVGDKRVQYEISDDADLYRDGNEVAASALRTGDQVSFQVVDGDVEYVIVTVRAEQSEYVSGTITEELDAQDEIEIRVNGTERDYDVDDQALIYRDHVKVDADDLVVGDEVFVRMEGNELTYIQVTKRAGQTAFAVQGELVSVGFDNDFKVDTISIRHTVGGDSQVNIYRISDSVTITNGNATDLTPGQDIELKGSLGVVNEIVIL